MSESVAASARLPMKEAAEALSVSLDSPPFPHQVGTADGYEALLSGDVSKGMDPSTLLGEARSGGRVLLHAPAGSGKTYLLARLFVEAVQGGEFASLVDLKNWTPDLFANWDALEASEVGRMSILLQKIAIPPANESDIMGEVGRESRWYVFVDALNEVPSPYPEQVLQTLDSFARRNPLVGVIVADRFSRRTLPSERWQLATILELDETVVADLLGDKKGVPHADLFQRPFFLNMALKHPFDSTTQASWFTWYFRDQIGLTKKQLETSSIAAFEVYRREKARSFNSDEFSSEAGERATSRLEESGALLKDEGGRQYFSHHLLHDFLVGRYLAERKSTWIHENFDIATFRASSFDVLSLALELIPEHLEADLFVRRLYDWNPYAPAYAIAMASQRDNPIVSRDMETAIAAMLAERRWEPIVSTAQRASDALRLLDTPWSEKMLDAKSLSDVLDATARLSLQEHFEQWKNVFIGEYREEDLLSKLTQQDSLIGWTAANVLRRAPLAEASINSLVEVFQDPSPIIRWRAAHVLGAQPLPSVITPLLEHLISDPYYWVRFGSLRALVELAAKSDSLRKPVFDELFKRLPDIQAGDLLWELERALVLQSPPTDWSVRVAPLIEWLWASARTVESQDHWRDVAYQVQRAAQAGA